MPRGYLLNPAGVALYYCRTRKCVVITFGCILDDYERVQSYVIVFVFHENFQQ